MFIGASFDQKKAKMQEKLLLAQTCSPAACATISSVCLGISNSVSAGVSVAFAVVQARALLLRTQQLCA
jgi:hypothetical protein